MSFHFTTFLRLNAWITRKTLFRIFSTDFWIWGWFKTQKHWKYFWTTLKLRMSKMKVKSTPRFYLKNSNTTLIMIEPNLRKTKKLMTFISASIFQTSPKTIKIPIISQKYSINSKDTHNIILRSFPNWNTFLTILPTLFKTLSNNSIK